MKKLVVAALFVIGSAVVATNTVNAEVLGEQHQSQEGEQKIEWKCNPKTTTTTGSYGTSTTTTEGNCEGSANQKFKQEQSQKILGEQIVVKDERGGRVHKPVNTALDTRTMIAAIGMTAVGGAAFVARKKIA